MEPSESPSFFRLGVFDRAESFFFYKYKKPFGVLTYFCFEKRCTLDFLRFSQKPLFKKTCSFFGYFHYFCLFACTERERNICESESTATFSLLIDSCRFCEFQNLLRSRSQKVTKKGRHRADTDLLDFKSIFTGICNASLYKN